MTNEIAINGYSLDFYKTFDHNNLEEMRLEADDGYINFFINSARRHPILYRVMNG